MELFSLSSPRITSSLPSSSTSSSSSSKKISIEKHSFVSTLTNNIKIYPDVRKLKFSDFRAQASGSVQGSRKSNPGVTKASKQDLQSKDNDVVFVAGATGKVGSRTVRELLKLGFQVRAGVRSSQRAEPLVQSVQQMKLDEGAAAVEKLKIVECDLERDRIEQAIGNASVVICCIGASEKEVFDITGPYRIDYQATKKLIDAATSAGVNHFILVSSLGTNKIGFPAAILNLFWGVLVWKRKAEEALIASGLPYTIVRPGGMERPTDAYKETHNIALAKEDTLFGGQVSNLQVAELMAFMAKNRGLSYCKVVEVVAETTAPLTPVGDLLAKIPSSRVDTSTEKEELQDAPPVEAVPPFTGNSAVMEKTPTQAIEKEFSEILTKKTSYLSPYPVYDDFKPPTSPSPNARTVSQPTTSGSPKIFTQPDTSTAQTPTSNELDEKYNISEPKPRPLSPFTMYEDLKPPTSPIQLK